MSKNLVVKSLPSLKAACEKKQSTTNREKILPSTFLCEYAKDKLYFIYTHGCQANHRDSEIIQGYLESVGFKKTTDVHNANVIVFNTCAVRENAENKVLGEIGNLKAYHQKNDVTIVLCGCMAMEETIVDKIIKNYTHVDIVFGTHDLHNLLNLLEEHIKNSSRIIDVHSGSGNIQENFTSVRENAFKAYVNITYGCNNFCSYCIVPYTRGRQRSRALDDIVNECKELVNSGYQEIVLLGQNVDSYGNDLENKISFATLLNEVAKLNIPRLSFLTSHPHDFKEEIIYVMKNNLNILPYLHLPVQSGDNHILSIMNRKYTREKYLSIIEKLKKEIPNIAIATDIIVGFPNETEDEFNNTLDLVNKVQYDGAFTFIYSPRAGTPAARIKDNVSYKTKVERFKKLTLALEKSIEKNNQRYINNVYPVLVDSTSKNNAEMLTGRLPTNKIVNFPGDASLIGKIIKIKINSSHLHYLLGEQVKDNIK